MWNLCVLRAMFPGELLFLIARRGAEAQLETRYRFCHINSWCSPVRLVWISRAEPGTLIEAKIPLFH
jgi:hypothetical protein